MARSSDTAKLSVTVLSVVGCMDKALQFAADRHISCRMSVIDRAATLKKYFKRYFLYPHFKIHPPTLLPGISVQTGLPSPYHARVLVRAAALRAHLLQELLTEGAVRENSHRGILLRGGGAGRGENTAVSAYHPGTNI